MTGAGNGWIVELRERFASPPPARLPPGEGRLASVLVPLFVEARQLWTVLTRRSDEVPHHRGQIAFPGGSCEIGEDAWTAALRESREEIALDPRQVIRLGELDELATPTGFRIVPCVGAVPRELDLAPGDGEIAEVFSVPLIAFSDVRVVEERQVTVNGKTRSYRVYHVGKRPIWGLTARIVQNLLERLGVEVAIPE